MGERVMDKDELNKQKDKLSNDLAALASLNAREDIASLLMKSIGKMREIITADNCVPDQNNQIILSQLLAQFVTFIEAYADNESPRDVAQQMARELHAMYSTLFKIIDSETKKETHE